MYRVVGTGELDISSQGTVSLRRSRLGFKVRYQPGTGVCLITLTFVRQLLPPFSELQITN
jgi:hypothetical protein